MPDFLDDLKKYLDSLTKEQLFEKARQNYPSDPKFYATLENY